MRKYSKKDYYFAMLSEDEAMVWFGDIKEDDCYVSLCSRAERGEVSMYRCKKLNFEKI